MQEKNVGAQGRVRLRKNELLRMGPRKKITSKIGKYLKLSDI